MFAQKANTLSKVGLLDLNLTVQSGSDNFNGKGLNSVDFYNTYERKYKDNLGGDNSKSKVSLNSLSSSYLSTINNLDLDNVFSEYSNVRKYFTKNVKNVVKTTTDLDAPANLWALNRLNSVASIYPNQSETLLSGNLLISSKESDGDFNTNLVPIKDPS